MVYLAINYGSYEGWQLIEYITPEQALDAVKAGGTYGNEWKILKVVPVVVREEDGPKPG